jgi:hypothetical protein
MDTRPLGNSLQVTQPLATQVLMVFGFFWAIRAAWRMLTCFVIVWQVVQV